MEGPEREFFFKELSKFRSIRSIEIARNNIERLELLVSSAKKDIRIRELTLANSRYADANSSQVRA